MGIKVTISKYRRPHFFHHFNSGGIGMRRFVDVGRIRIWY